ncbi:MAG: carbon-nitrogen hydrolase family protein [Nocardioidaceae bacterium]
MRTSVVQLAAGTDAEANLESIRRLVRAAAGDGGELIVVPEAAMYDFGAPDLPLGPPAQSVDGSFVGALGSLARETSTTLVAGMFETSPDPDRPYNTLVVVGPDGELVASYRKTHLYDSFGYQESERLLAGEGKPVVVRVGDFSVGLQTCYDLRFPEFSRALVDAGADLLVVPAAWVRGPLKEEHWATLLRARAIENTVYVAAAAQTAPTYAGRSMIIDPMGVAMAALGDETGTAGAVVEPERLEAVRRRNPSLANRRLPTMR